MPSGAKKRKAAKKKKEQETHNGTSNPPPPPQGSNDVNSQDKGVPRDAEAVQKVGIERELKDDTGSKDVVIEDAKSGKGSSNGDDRSASRSSSDEESRVVDRRRKEDTYALVPEEKIHNEDVPAGKTTSSATTESAPSVESVKHEVSVTESTLDESAAISNDVVNAGLENSTETSLPIGDPVSKKTEDKSLPLLNDTAKASLSVVESAYKENESKALPLLNDTAKASLSVVESASTENEGKALPSLGTSLAQVSNDAEPIKDTEVPEYSEKQPLIAPAPPVAQKASWLSCCGILEAITGSGR